MVRLSRYEPIEWFQPKRGDIVLDIGAFVGRYTLAAACGVGPEGRVIALEPDPRNDDALRLNVTLNGLGNVTVVPKAAWRQTGSVGWESSHEAVWHRIGANGRGPSVAAVRIDDLVEELGLKRVDWMKVDVEGAEAAVLEGAVSVVRRWAPAMFIEVHGTSREVDQFLSNHGYGTRQKWSDRSRAHGWILAHH